MSEHDDGIFPPFEAFYIQSLLFHTHSAFASIVRISTWFEFVRSDDERMMDLSKDELLRELRNISREGAAVSRYLFPAKDGPGKLHQKRAQKLRASLRISDASPLKDRRLRNQMEHFEERLDEYLAGDVLGEFVPFHVAYDKQEFEIPTHIFFGFYLKDATFVVLGEEHQMVPLVKELDGLHDKLLKCSENGYRLPSSGGT